MSLHFPRSKNVQKRRRQHPSPNVKTFCKFEPQIWLEIITSRDAKSACFKGSRTSCREIIFGIFWPNFGQKRSHHVMDASCRRRASAVAENFRQNAEIVGNCVSHILDVKHCKTRGADNVGKCREFGRRLLQTPEVRSALQTPLCTALSLFQFCGLGFSCLVAPWHHSNQRVEPSISLLNSHGAFAHNQAMEK